MYIEPLESRIAPASIVVNSLTDAALRQAVAGASAGDTISFASILHGTLVLTSPINISIALTIEGHGTPNSSAHNSITLSGNKTTEIFDIIGTGNVYLSNLNFTKGSATDGGAISANDTGTHGVTITGCSFTANKATGAAGATGTSAHGGAIDVAGGSLALLHSSLSGNTIQGGAGTSTGGYGEGGAVFTGPSATADFNTDTFSGNSAIGGLGSSTLGGRGQGGAIYAGGTVTVESSTFSGNLALGGNSAGNYNTSAPKKGAGGGAGGGLYEGAAASVQITGSLFSKNHATGGTGLTGTAGTNGNVGSAGGSGGYGGYGGYGAGGALSGSGGLTISTSTISGNIAKGGNGGAGGAGGKGGPAHGSTHAGVGGSGGEGGNGGSSFGAGVAGQYSTSVLSITSSTISGNTASGGTGGKGGAAGSGAHSSTPPSHGSNGKIAYGYGGGIDSYKGGSLTLTGVTVSKNSAADGGGIHSYYTATIGISTSTISSNKSSYNGGGLDLDTDSGNTSNVTISNSTLSGNSAENQGGGIYLYNATLKLSQVTVAGNSAAVGGGLSLYGGGATINNSTIAFNKASSVGGGINEATSGAATLTSTVVAGNSVPAHHSGADVDGTINAYYSLIQNTNSLTISNTTGGPNILNANPLLQSLKFNGGPTETILFTDTASKISPLLNPSSAV